MKISKKKVLGIVASIGLSAGALGACSSSKSNEYAITKSEYKDYKCDKKETKSGKIKCEDSNGSTSHSSFIYVPSRYVSDNGSIKSSFVKSGANIKSAVSTPKSVSGSKGIGSSHSSVSS
ncbi:hypothetical protein [Heyndrickxia ginsengihumi]|uniref:hypothetical protein n=1 Tax=Heyndrickxia ginsengihumi TaxID=363870 RepID=UPI000471C01B|nr:hypothetical protein [Heyndrickxia ginsengihumi]